MNKINCDICLDLIPLVIDNIASEDSRLAVIDHINECNDCKEFYELENYEQPVMDDTRVIYKIKKQLYLAGLITIVVGAVLGVALTDGMGIFYNILIMPTIGVLGYFVIPKKSYYIPLTLFVFVYIWLLIKTIAEGWLTGGSFILVMLNPLSWAFIYSGLCILGIIIGFLLKIAFKKEVKNEKNS